MLVSIDFEFSMRIKMLELAERSVGDEETDVIR